MPSIIIFSRLPLPIGTCMALFEFSYFGFILAITACFGSAIRATSTYFIQPSEFGNQTLDDYVREPDKYFVDNTTFIFLPGIHRLNISLDLENISNVIFLVSDEDELKNDVSLVFSPLVNITWTNCSDIQISGLHIVLSGRKRSEDDDSSFSSFVFHRTTGSLSRLTFLGNKTMLSTAIFMNDFSSIKISDVMVSEAISIQGAAIHADNSRVDISGQNTFISNQATDEGGAIALHSCTCNITGNTSFVNNFAWNGGAIALAGGNHSNYGDVSFISNVAIGQGGALVLRGAWYSTSGRISFVKNSGTYGGAISVPYGDTTVILDNAAFISNNASYGGAIELSYGDHNVAGNILFANNSAGIYGGAIAMLSGNHNISGNFSFENNMSDDHGGAVALTNDCQISGTISFVNNTAKLGGALSFSDSFESTHSIVGSISFIGNSATKGGAVYSAYSGTRTISGNVSFISNSANHFEFGIGGAIFVDNSDLFISGVTSFVHNHAIIGFGGAIAANSSNNIELIGEVLFEGNTANLGGAIYMENSFASISGTHQYIQNFAEQGGTMAFSRTSKLMLTRPLTVDYIENHATSVGGVIFVDTNYDNQCSQWPAAVEECFFELRNYSASDIHLNFINNTADQAGRILYGGNIDKCKLYIQDGTIDNCGNRQGGAYDYKPISKFQSISNIVNVDEKVSDISSDPLEVCFCGEFNDWEIRCENHIKNVVRGREFMLGAVIVGQNKGTVPSAVRIVLNNNIKVDETQHIQNTTNECSLIKYRLFSNDSTTTLTLFPDDSPCRDSGISRREVKVIFDRCPDAFDLVGSECVCDERLINKKYTTNCSVEDNSISRSSNTFWMGVAYENMTFKGLILHSGCPFDYCVDTLVSITLNNLDIQCDHNHSSILCGSCKDNYSIAFGTVHCLHCSNAYLALILPFALAGIALVAILLLLKLSVANGTINGLIFYANIVQANRSTFFPLGKTNILTVFIAWLNLDLGIETCFYDGMDAYGFTWLQFLFPFYVWFLIGLIIVVTHYSQKATSMFGSNPVAALATLLLLSYSKLLRTVIMALSVTSLEYPYTHKKVWLYDGNVPYFQRADHIVLGIFAITVLLLLFLPYTLLLFFGHWLQAYSHWKLFSWINKIKPFLDAYHAPCKKETRYWTGFLLLVRCVLLLTFGLNAFGNANVNLLAITSFTACLPALASLHKGIYKTAYNNILEISFTLNLCIFSAATYHVKEIEGNQAGLAYTSVGIAFSTFLVIVFCHLYLALSKTSVGKKLPSPNAISRIIGEINKDGRAERENAPTCEPGEQHNLANQTPTTTFIDIREYEPLLDSKQL